MTEYEIETYKAGYWIWVVLQSGSQKAYGGYCRTRRKARKEAIAWIEANAPDSKSKADLRDKRIKDKTMRKETYRG